MENFDLSGKKNKIKDFVNFILNIIYPQNLSCIFCDMPISRTNKYSVCRTCYNQMVFIINACPKCGKPSVNTNLKRENDILNCDYCRNKAIIYDRNISFLEYDDKSKHLIFDLKYNSKTFLVNIICHIMIDMIREMYSDIIDAIDYITYVPMSKKRTRERGFNQAKEIAERLGDEFSIECLDILVRNRETKKLHGLNSSDRKKELKGAFDIDEDSSKYIEGKVVAVVDDIFTTGATLNEISKKLKIAGVDRVIGLTFLTGRYEKPVIEDGE